MTQNPDPAMLEPTQDLAQFEPDPEGVGSLDDATQAAPSTDDPQWITWPDPAEESVWAASELSQIGAGKT